MRVVPVTGKDVHRQQAESDGKLYPYELYTTKDQLRVWFHGQLASGSVIHSAAAESEMLALNSDETRGVWPGDFCIRTDYTPDRVFLCITNNGESSLDWIALATTQDTGTGTDTGTDTGTGTGTGGTGFDGWSPVLAVESDGERRVLKIVDWTGGTGTMPPVNKYIGSTGLEDLIANGVDIRGAPGGGGGSGSLETYENILVSYTGLVHRWKFDEASGNFADSVGSLTFTPTGGTMTYQQAGPLGSNSAARFGASARLETSGLGSVPTGAAARTFVALIRNPNPATAVLGGYGTTSTRAWFTPYLHSNGPALTVWSDDLGTVEFPLCDGKWHVVAFGYDGVRSTFAYIDGQIRGKTLSGDLVTPTTGNFNVNLQTGIGGTDWSQGEMDDFAVFTSYLSKAQLDALYMAVNELPVLV